MAGYGAFATLRCHTAKTARWIFGQELWKPKTRKPNSEMTKVNKHTQNQWEQDFNSNLNCLDSADCIKSVIHIIKLDQTRHFWMNAKLDSNQKSIQSVPASPFLTLTYTHHTNRWLCLVLGNKAKLACFTLPLEEIQNRGMLFRNFCPGYIQTRPQQPTEFISTVTVSRWIWMHWLDWILSPRHY